MEANSLTKKRRKYNSKIKTIRFYLKDYYDNKEFSILNYENNIATTQYNFLNDIYDQYDQDFKSNPQNYDYDINNKIRKCTIHIVHILESILIKYKKRIKEIDKELFE